MDETELTARLREIQVSLNIYVKKFESFEQELSGLKHNYISMDTRHGTHIESVKELKATVDNLRQEITKHKDEFNKFYLEFSNHVVNASGYTNEFSKIGTEEASLRNSIHKCEQQISELMHTSQVLQKGLTELSELFEKLDETVTKNDLLIGKLNFTLRSIIGLISGLVAVVGTAIAGWDYLVEFFSK